MYRLFGVVVVVFHVFVLLQKPSLLRLLIVFSLSIRSRL
jgi:hypothetical protein